jgi:hypothetical protein
MDTDIPGVLIRTPSPAAERMREYRRRRRYGLLSIRIRLASAYIDALIKKSYLKPEHRGDRNEIAIAVGDLISDTLLNT